jgi:hypothetical protein
VRAGPLGKEGQAAGKGWGRVLGFGWFSFSKSFPFPSTQNYLNSNEFEFNSYTNKQNKTMLQHECNNQKLNL